MGCCLFALILAGFPRIVTLIYWMLNPLYTSGLFSNWFIPVLGIICLPWTTLAYILVGKNPGVFEIIILVFAFFLDISTYGGGGGAAKKRRSN
jgi:hypothetical protein